MTWFKAPRTCSGAYRLPPPTQVRWCNILLRMAAVIPSRLGELYLRRRKFYQTVLDADPEDTQGDSHEKWRVIRSVCDFSARSVLDIGCSEGFFCIKAFQEGATPVVGVDSEFRTLLSAKLLTRSTGCDIEYRLGVFPTIDENRCFDRVLCLSVLHHLVPHGICTVLCDTGRSAEFRVLNRCLQRLRSLVCERGLCIVEIPYEYTRRNPRGSVDFDRFSQELLQAGFAKAESVGLWRHARRNQDRKDRVIYAAYAG